MTEQEEPYEDRMVGAPCMNCSVGDYEKGLTSELLERGETTVVVKDVPALVCWACGDALTTGEVTDELLEILDEAVEEGVRSEVRSYDPAAERERIEKLKETQKEERAEGSAHGQWHTQQRGRGQEHTYRRSGRGKSYGERSHGHMSGSSDYTRRSSGRIRRQEGERPGQREERPGEEEEKER